mgnify:FL=1
MKNPASMAQPDLRPYTRTFFRGNRLNFGLALIDVFLSAAINLLISWLLQQIVDLIGGSGTVFSLRQLALITALVIAVTAASYLFSYFFKPRFLTRAMAQYRETLFGRLMEKPLAAFTGENSSLYLSALTNDLSVIEKGCLTNLFSLTNSLLLFVGAFAMMLWYSPLLTLAAVLLALLPVTASLLMGGKAAGAEKLLSDQNEACTAALKDALGGFSVIKSFQAEKQMCRLFAENVRRLTHARCQKERIGILIQMMGSLAGITAQLGVFLIGAVLALSGKSLTVGTVLLFVQLMNYVISPISVIPVCLAERKAARALIAKAASALEAAGEPEGSAQLGSLTQGIELSHLAFSYEDDKPILRDISFSFEPGKSYAVVGASGSGKSTLLHLLSASQTGYSGQILYDGQELRDIRRSSLYDLISVIQQNVFIFNATIRENITLFADFPEEAVERAIRLSGLSGLIRERGEDYLCGENGTGLSGGEKQRISIARSLLKNAQVLLVDEATAALDAQTAHQVSHAILDLSGMTRIVVTHTLEESALRRYDAILTLRDGSIAEQGSFEELMERRGYFYSLYTVSQ